MSECVEAATAVPDRPRLIELEGPRNLRDLGGYATRDGRTTRWGRLYRADALAAMTPADLDRFAELGIATVYDLRHDFERDRQPNPVPSVHVSLMGKVVGDEGPDFGEMTSAEHGRDFMRSMMLNVLAHAGPEIGQVVTGLAAADQLPALFHCTAGKDRTGILAAIVLEVLGVAREVVVDDFHLTEVYRAVGEDSTGFAMMLERGVPPEAAAGALGAPRETMVEILADLDRGWGGAERYLTDEGGVDRDALDRLRDNLLD